MTRRPNVDSRSRLRPAASSQTAVCAVAEHLLGVVAGAGLARRGPHPRPASTTTRDAMEGGGSDDLGAPMFHAENMFSCYFAKSGNNSVRGRPRTGPADTTEIMHFPGTVAGFSPPRHKGELLNRPPQLMSHHRRSSGAPRRRRRRGRPPGVAAAARRHYTEIDSNNWVCHRIHSIRTFFV